MTPVAHYDSLTSPRDDMLLDLPFREGVGALTYDVAKPHHPVTLVATPTWTPLASGLGTLNFGGLGANEYLECPGADCVDLDFTNHNYSIWGWFNWTVNEFSQIIIGRYEVSVSGWELYLTEAAGIHYLTLRHHHAATLVPPVTGVPRTGAYSVGWTPGVDHFFGVLRIGANVAFVRNGILLETVSDVMVDPETSAEDLVIGCRYSKDANFFDGMQYRPRIAGGLILDGIRTTRDFDRVYEREAVWFP